jgi:hypothetical protein
MSLLPLEMVNAITEYLSIKEVLNFTSTCSYYHNLLSFFLERRDVWVGGKDGVEKENMVKRLSYTKVADVSKLGSVYRLYLSHSSVVDVSMLGGVHTLDLSNTNVVNVSMLGGVYDLNLSHTKVVDVSMLGGVHSLSLYGREGIDISKLGGVCDLRMDVYLTK